MRGLFLSLSFLGACASAPTHAAAQFVFPKDSDHVHDPGLYTEDPFIVQYRQRFFSVFKGDYKTYRAAYEEIANDVLKNPNDARAVVWLGNGQTIEAALKLLKGQKTASLELLKTARRNLNRAVSLRPNDPNIYMMRAATLYIQGQYWPAKDLPPAVWDGLRDDCLRFIDFLGPKRLARVSVHVRGETLGELGIAYKNLGDSKNALQAFRKVEQLCPATDYETRAKKEILTLQSG
jgi:tetratricopeptide (TPR) repeat protein